MEVSDKGAVEIAEHEGIVVAPYRDSVGVLTYLIGHTKAAGGLNPKDIELRMPVGKEIDQRITLALEVFADDLAKYAARVNAALNVEVTQYEFDALVSFDFNTGAATWKGGRGQQAGVFRHLNAGNRTKAAAAFMGWLRPPELRKRRTAEMNLFITGDYDANGDAIPVWGTNGKGKLVGVVRTISGNDLLRRMGGKRAAPMSKSGLTPAWLAWLISFILGRDRA